jgi:ATP synthase F0, B subunit
MLNDVNNIKKKYNIENLEISAKDLFEFEKKLFEKEKRMFWRLSEDLINKKNYDEVNKLLDFIFNDIETVLIKDGKEINLSKIENEKALKRIEELGEVKVVENYKARKYCQL